MNVIVLCFEGWTRGDVIAFWSMIFTILSFFVSGVIMVLLYIMKARKDDEEEAELNRKEARDFIEKYKSEAKYIIIADMLSKKYPEYLFERQMYNDYIRCSNKVREEILNQCNIKPLKCSRKQNEKNLIEKLIETTEKVGLNPKNCIFYEHAKHFRRALNYRNYLIKGTKKDGLELFNLDLYDIEDEFYSRDESAYIDKRIDDYFANIKTTPVELKKYLESNNVKLYNSLLDLEKCLYYAYKIPNTTDEFIEIHKENPLDYYLKKAEKFHDDAELCYMYIQIVISSIFYIVRTEGLNPKFNILKHSDCETVEDLYFNTILMMYSYF